MGSLARWLCAFLISVSLACSALAQVAVDATGSASKYAAGPITTTTFTNLTVGSGTNRALVAVITFDVDPGAFTAAKWGTQNLTQIVKNTGSDGTAILFGLVNPTSGNQTFTFTWTTSANDTYIDAISFTGVDQTGGATSFPNSTTASPSSTATPSITITSATGNYTVSAMTMGQNTTSNNQTLLYFNHSGSFVNSSAQYAAGAATVTHSWVLTAADIPLLVGTDVLAAGGGGGPTCPQTLALLGVGC